MITTSRASLASIHEETIELCACRVSIDVVPSKNQVLCEYCAQVSNYSLTINTVN